MGRAPVPPSPAAAACGLPGRDVVETTRQLRRPGRPEGPDQTADRQVDSFPTLPAPDPETKSASGRSVPSGPWKDEASTCGIRREYVGRRYRVLSRGPYQRGKVFNLVSLSYTLTN